MSAPIRKVLVVGVARDAYARFEPVLRRQAFDADWVGSARVAEELIGAVAFDVLILAFPLDQPGTAGLMRLARAENGPCRRAAVLVMAQEENLGRAREIVASGHNKVVSLSADQSTIQAEVAALLRVAPRLSVRLPIRLEVQLGEGRTVALSQTENVSATGMLVRCERRFPLESDLRFELFVPDQTGSISGQGQVVRHTTGARGRTSGMGVRFLRWDGQGQARLQSFLASSGSPGR